jgi:catalase
MPFEDAKTYRINPFDLTKVWPHGDYPLIEVGKMTLNRNVVDYHAQIEQAAFEPNNIVPGTGLSPDKMLLARGFSYADAHRARLGVNYKQIPVNEPKVEVNAYSKDGAMRIKLSTDPVYAPNSMGGPVAEDPRKVAEVHWASDGDMVRTAYALRPEDDDWSQAGALVRDVFDDDARERLVGNIVGHVLDGVKEPVLSRVFEYWTNVDPEIGKKVEEGVRAGG